MRACECRLLKPQRQVRLSSAEEAVRCRHTWQLYDRRMWEAAFGGVKTLQNHVVDAKAMQNRLQDLVLGFSDQVPWWGLVKQSKQLYAVWEFSRRAAAERGCKVMQKRGHDDDEASKFRITVELRQVILNWFHPVKEPIGVCGPTLVIVGGQTHCRLSNIDAEGRWVESETFLVGGKPVVRVKGRYAGGTMKPWVELRARAPELFEGITVMQQPAAVSDSVIMSWALEELGRLYPCSIWQRDLSGGGGFSLAARQRMQLVNQIPVWVMGKMTAALQITDTDFAYPLKAYAKSAKEELKQQLKAVAAKAGLPPILKCGAFEILSIIKKSVDQLAVRCRKDNLVLAAARRNGMLAYRRDFEADLPPLCCEPPPEAGVEQGQVQLAGLTRCPSGA